MSPSAGGTLLPSCRPPPQPSPQGGGCPVGGRWSISDRAAIRGTAYVAHPPPSLPHKGPQGGVPSGVGGTILPGPPAHTLPLVGRAGEGGSRQSSVLLTRRFRGRPASTAATTS